MAKEPAGKKPAPRKTPTKKPATPAKKVVGKTAPARKAPAKKTAPAKAPAKAKAAPRKNFKKYSEQDAPHLGLTPKEQWFVDEYMVDRNATQAAIRAKYSPHTARQIGYENLTKPHIQLAIAEAMKAQQERTQITADRVLLEAWNIATADARELTSLIYTACRHCHGIGHKYQWRDEEEFERALAKAQEAAKAAESAGEEGMAVKLPTNEGGYGFTRFLNPVSSCTKCDGEGIERVQLGDTRFLSPQAVSLFAGVKQTKFGIEMLTHNKLEAIEKLNKHLGVYEKDNQQKTDPLAALLSRISTGNGNGFAPVQDDPERVQSSIPVAQADPVGDEDED